MVVTGCTKNLSCSGRPSLRIVALLSLGCEIAVAALSPAEDYFAYRGDCDAIRICARRYDAGEWGKRSGTRAGSATEAPTRPAAVPVCEIRISSKLLPACRRSLTQCGCLPLPVQVSDGRSGFWYLAPTFGYGRRWGASAEAGKANLRLSLMSRS